MLLLLGNSQKRKPVLMRVPHQVGYWVLTNLMNESWQSRPIMRNGLTAYGVGGAGLLSHHRPDMPVVVLGLDQQIRNGCRRRSARNAASAARCQSAEHRRTRAW